MLPSVFCGSNLLVLVNIVLLHRGCVGQSNGDLRLNNDDPVLLSNITEGRLEIYLDSEWGTVCDDNFMMIEATVACRQLGYYEALEYGVVGSFGFQKGDDEVLIHLDQVNCTGKEDALHLMSCANVAHNEHDCVHNEDVALKCSEKLLSDVDPFNGQVRVVDGAYSSEGLVEVYCNEQWGTICDDYFNRTEANTICLQLGYTHAEKFDHLIKLTGNESQPIWLDNVQCNTNKQCISMCQQCPEREFHDCIHREDITIKCSFSSRRESNNIGRSTCRIDYSSSISGEVIAVIIVSLVFVLVCFSLCSVCIALCVCWVKAKRSAVNNDDSISNATEMTRSTISCPIPPPRPSDLPPLSTPTISAFSPTFSPFSPFDASQPIPPPRPQNLGKLTTPTNPLNPLLSPYPMPQALYESTPVYIAPGNTGRPIYLDPGKMDAELPPPSYPNCVNHYERTPTGMFPLAMNQEMRSSGHYESIPPLVGNDYIDSDASVMQLQQKVNVAKFGACAGEEGDGQYENLDQIREAPYDNLRPQKVVDVGNVQQTALDVRNGESNVDHVSSYVNLKEVQAKETPSYDFLASVRESDKENGISANSTPPTDPQLNDVALLQDDAETTSPHYENIAKERPGSVKNRQKKCNSVTW